MRNSIEDEFGVEWKVEARDPAREHVLALGRAGYTWIVLPRAVLRGTIEPVRAKESILAGASPAAGATPATMTIARTYRLLDCLEELNA